MNRIRPSELHDLAGQCASLFDAWPVPHCLVNLSATSDVLLHRLAARHSASVRAAEHDLPRLIAMVRRLYAAVVQEDGASMPATLREVLGPWRRHSTVHVLDTTHDSPAETAAQVARLARFC